MGATDAMLFAIYPQTMKGIQPEPILEAPFYFHTPPGSYQRGGGDPVRSKHQLYKIGERSSHGGVTLRTVSWSSMFALSAYLFQEAQEDGYPSWVMSPPDDFQFQDAFQSRDIIDNLRESGEIVRLIIKDPNVGYNDVNMLAQITSFSFSNVEGEPDIRNYSITFEQWKPVHINTVGRAGNRPGTTAPATLKPRVKNPYTLPRDMSLRDIAWVAYRNRAYGNYIMYFNGGKKWLMAVKAKHQGISRKGMWIIPKGTKVRLPTKKP